MPTSRATTILCLVLQFVNVTTNATELVGVKEAMGIPKTISVLARLGPIICNSDSFKQTSIPSKNNGTVIRNSI